MTLKRHTHGGKRPGSGRKRIGAKPKAKITISIDPGILKQLKRMSGDLTTSEAIEKAVRSWLPLDPDALLAEIDRIDQELANDDK